MLGKDDILLSGKTENLAEHIAWKFKILCVIWIFKNQKSGNFTKTLFSPMYILRQSFIHFALYCFIILWLKKDSFECSIRSKDYYHRLMSFNDTTKQTVYLLVIC